MRWPRRRAADPWEGRAEGSLLSFQELQAAGIQPREAVHMGLEGVLDVRESGEGRVRGVTVASARAYLAKRGPGPEEIIHVHPRREAR